MNFNDWFSTNGDIIRFISIICAIAAAVLTIITLLLKHKRALLKKLLEWASESFADGKITRQEFSNLMDLLKDFKASEEAAAKLKEAELNNGKVEVAGDKIKVKKEKRIRVIAEKEKIPFTLIIKDKDGKILFTENYPSKRDARKGCKTSIENLVNSGSTPATFKLVPTKKA